jgi:hypothetical protein
LTDFLCFDKANAGAVIVSHAGGKYDEHFVLEELLNRGKKPSLTANGHRIITMTAGVNCIFKVCITLYGSHFCAPICHLLFWHSRLNFKPFCFRIVTVSFPQN